MHKCRDCQEPCDCGYLRYKSGLITKEVCDSCITCQQMKEVDKERREAGLQTYPRTYKPANSKESQ